MPTPLELFEREVARTHRKRRVVVPALAPDPLPYLDLGAQVYELRSRRRWSQVALAKRTGLQQSEISRIESRAANPTLQTLEALARVFGMRVTFAPIPPAPSPFAEGPRLPPEQDLSRKRKR